MIQAITSIQTFESQAMTIYVVAQMVPEFGPSCHPKPYGQRRERHCFDPTASAVLLSTLDESPLQSLLVVTIECCKGDHDLLR